MTGSPLGLFSSRCLTEAVGPCGASGALGGTVGGLLGGGMITVLGPSSTVAVLLPGGGTVTVPGPSSTVAVDLNLLKFPDTSNKFPDTPNSIPCSEL